MYYDALKNITVMKCPGKTCKYIFMLLLTFAVAPPRFMVVDSAYTGGLQRPVILRIYFIIFGSLNFDFAQSDVMDENTSLAFRYLKSYVLDRLPIFFFFFFFVT